MGKVKPGERLAGSSANSGIFSSARRRSPSVFPGILPEAEGKKAMPGYHHGILNTLPEIAFELDEEGRVRFINDTALRLLGIPGEEMEGKPLEAFVAGDAAGPGIGRALGGEDPGPLEFDLVRRDGTRLAVRCSLTIIELGGNVVGLRGIAADMSEERRMKKELERASRLRASYESAARSGHDLRNILCVLHSSIEYLRAFDYGRLEAGDIRNIRETLGDAAEAIGRGVNLTNDMMQLASAERMRFGRVDLGLMVEQIVRERRQGASGGAIAFISECEPVVLETADREKLHRAVDNMIANSVDAMEGGGGIIEVRVTESMLDGKPAARIMVRDTGCGIPPDMVESVFEPFVSTKGTRGTGLGLAIAAAVVDSHGGTISVESEPGRGTTFEIVIPQR